VRAKSKAVAAAVVAAVTFGVMLLQLQPSVLRTSLAAGTQLLWLSITDAFEL
jgi:hypothetical protein